jgi:hypothetical protein
MEEIKKILWVMNPGVALRVSKSKVFVTFKFKKNTFKTFFETTMKLLRVDRLDYDTVDASAQGVPPPDHVLRTICSLLEEKIAASAKSENGAPKL